MSKRVTPSGAARIEAARETYVTALRRLNKLRCNRSNFARCSDYGKILQDARRLVHEALAEWTMLIEHETGVSLTAGVKHDFAQHDAWADR